MGSIGLIIKAGLALSKQVHLPKLNPHDAQVKTLIKLLRKAELTDFGVEYNFSKILESEDLIAAYQQKVPIHSYEKMFAEWWKTMLQGEKNVTWPGKVHYFALSSGTSSGTTKYLPVTKSMLRAIQKASFRQMMALANCDLPESFFEKAILMLGGSTDLDYNGMYYAGDLSGITTGNIPFWFQPYYKPGREIASTRNWQEKLDLITREAHKWDVGAIAGNPSWFQILLERIIEHHGVKTIHDIWPNLQVFTHGAVAFEPYKKSFETLLAKPLIYLETYLASEGFIAYQERPNAKGMKLIVKNGIFYEFVPFNAENIDEDGNIRPGAKALHIGQVKEGEDYAILLSTCAGAWRYVIGDVIQFVNLANREIRIIGRTKHYLSLAGEHLSVENMNQAIKNVGEELNIQIKEFTVAGVREDNRFSHHWFIGTENQVDKDKLRERLDYHLAELNDDYKVERHYALKNIYIDILPNDVFIDFLRSQGKEGAQIKFPRVLKGPIWENWKEYLREKQDFRFPYD